MDKRIINTHDKFFKSLFSKKNQVREFVSKTIRPEIVENLDLNTLELDKTEYLDNQLRSSYSDLVYNCKYGNNTNVKISLLFEHKSQPEKYPHFQLLGYMLRIWEIQIKQNQRLTAVIPIIFYHGKKKWNNKDFVTYFGSIDKELQKFIPTFDYELIDTSTYSDKELAEHFDSIELQIGLLVMKNISNEQELLQKLNVIFAKLNQLLQTEQGKHFFDSIATYLLNATKIDSDKYVENMGNISQQAEQQFVSTAMKLEFKGRQEGRQESIEKVAIKLIIKGYSNEMINDITGLTEKDIKILRELHKNKKHT